MNQKNQVLESYIQKPTYVLRRGSSLDTTTSLSQKRFSLKRDNQYQSMIEDASVDSDGSNMTSFTTTTTASSASSPASIQVTPAHQRQLQFRRRMQQQKLAANVMMRIQNQSRSDHSSSDDGMPQPSKHRVASGIHMAHNKTIAAAGLISETIEMKNLPTSPPSSASSSLHQIVKQEDSTKTTISTLSATTDREFTIETTLSSKDDEEKCYRRSRSFHGKG